MSVALTAFGVVSAHGRGLEPLAAALRAGKTGVRKLTRFPAEALCSDLAAEAPVTTGADRTLGLLQLAADDALADRDWAPSPRRAVLLGSTKGSLEKVLEQGLSDPFAHLAAWLAQRSRSRGPVRAIGAACASSTAAVGAALALIESGRCDQAIVAGVEALHAFVYSGFHALKAMSPRAAAPFDLHRQGLSMGEGAAVLVLESPGFAAASGRKVLGWIDGFGAATDAHDQTAPHPEGEGLLQACRAALWAANLEPGQIGRYHAHGTATVQNDQMEAAMCARLFGPRGMPVCAAKGSVGHTLGSAGALDLLSALAALNARELWPITGLAELDPRLQIAPVTAVRSDQNPRALVATAGFGGINAALVLRRSDA
jgi:3-oxoacyl-[acyl-carrier-protein] synthase II